MHITNRGLVGGGLPGARRQPFRSKDEVPCANAVLQENQLQEELSIPANREVEPAR
jgi:hypothetical protein